MITNLVARNYGCLKDVDVRFTGLHALIGPNDAGKSTILRAVRTVSELADGGADLTGAELADGLVLRATTRDGYYAFSTAAGDEASGVVHGREEIASGERRDDERRDPRVGSPLLARLERGDPRTEVVAALRHVRSFALCEDALRSPSGFIPKSELALSPRGAGLPGLYFALRNDREDVFERTVKSVRALFPTVKTIRTQPRTPTELELEVELTGGVRIRGPHIGSGLLYTLAFAALGALTDGTRTLLLEEPEKGIHPARIRELMGILREVHRANDVQIILTTYSPLVINELRPSEVSVVTRPAFVGGTVVTPIRETANFDRRAGVYALGELWLSYADGQLEAPLLSPFVR